MNIVDLINEHGHENAHLIVANLDESVFVMAPAKQFKVLPVTAHIVAVIPAPAHISPTRRHMDDMVDYIINNA